MASFTYKIKNVLIFSSIFFISADLVNADQMLINQDFEESGFGAWQINQWGGTMQRKLVSPGKDGSSQSVELSVSGDPKKAILLQTVDVEMGETYVGSIAVKAEKDVPVTLRLRKTSPDYNVWGEKTVTAGSNWSEIDFFAYPTETCTSRFEVSIGETNVNIQIDDSALNQEKSDRTTAKLERNEAVPNQFFGIHSNKGHLLDLWTTMGGLGFKTIRLWDTGTDWASIEKSQDQFDWIRMDMYINRIRKYLPEAEIIYTFGRVPAWANSSTDTALPPKSIADWSDFVSHIVERYGQDIDYYEIWNEMDVEIFWKGTIDQMISLHAEAAKIIRAADPTAKIIMPNITPSAPGMFDAYLSAGGAAISDIVSVHSYPEITDIKDNLKKFTVFSGMLESHGFGNLPIFNTEGAVKLPSDSAVNSKDGYVALAEYFIFNWFYGSDRAVWYFWENTPNTNRMQFTVNDEEYATLNEYGIALAELIRWVAGSKLSISSDDYVEDDFTVIKIEKDTIASYLVWPNSGEQDFSVPSQWDWDNACTLDRNCVTEKANKFLVSQPVLFSTQSTASQEIGDQTIPLSPINNLRIVD